MSASQTLGGCSRAGRVLGPSLDKIIKNVAWRKNSQLVSSCRCAIDKLETISELRDPDFKSPLFGISFSDSEIVLQPVILALDSNSSKVAEPALECAFKLFSFGLIRADVDRIEGSNDPASLTSHLLDVICKCGGLGDEGIELSLLRALLSAIRSPYLLIRGDCLLHIVRTCYNVYLGSSSGTNQICAKSVLAQIMVIVFSRAEEDKMEVNVVSVSVYGLLEFTDKNLSEGNSIQFAQYFINEVLEACEVAMEIGKSHDLPLKIQNGDGIQHKADGKQDSQHGGDSNGLQTHQGESKIREDGFLLFKNLCKLSMKFSAQEHSDDDILLRGKVLSLELLRVVMDNASPIWRSDERFLGALKQYLCLSLLKNSGISVMIIFQLLCSIFLTLLVKFRAGLKAEIGIFFPMLILRVLENVAQPSFLQKMTILGLLDKISQDPHIIIDLFVNYDCDLDAPNIFERTVNGLLKTSLGPAPASSSTLSLPQDFTFRIESVKCLSGIIKSMGYWMDQQLRIGAFNPEKNKLSYSSIDVGTALNGEEGAFSDLEQHPELSSEPSDASAFEQRRAYKAELQKGISLFNKKPSKGIEFLMKNNKIGSSSEEVANFLKGSNGLNKAMIGDYLGEREEFPLKVMHAYVDSCNFVGMDFGEAIRFFLRGFRLPGEAQKIDRIMEKFAERYCKCNPSAFTRADTAYVLGYSVIMLNTDAHNDMVKDKMTKSDFIRNNRGIDDGKDLPEDFLGALYDQIVKNEIKMSAEASASQGKNVNGLNKFLGLDGILNLVFWKQPEEKPLGANGDLIRHIQAQIRSKSGKSESTYYAVTDAAILKFMIEVSWGPMLAAFSVTLDQSDDKAATSKCLDGFRFAVHVTSVMGMQTQRDAFVTTVAKFTYLHCAADMKQKNIEAMKTIVSIAIEDGDNLHEAWEHVLTCLSRFEHLQLLGDAVLPDASFFTNKEAQDKSQKALAMSSLSKKEALQNPAVMAVVRGGSYDSTSVGLNTMNLVSLEQINNFISNLNLLDQIGSFELNHIFAHSQRLNSEAIVAFVNALCKVAMSELQSATDPHVFCLTKIVEVAHYNMNRIRLVWSRIWNVLSDFFVLVGLSENLSVAIFVMDSLRQLSMKFLEREELANYNFQNEFLRPFAIVMQKSSSAEIRELIVRCISQMVLTCVYNVKSGWKSVFLVFTAAAADERKNIVLLAFETMEKIVREYFRYITETDTLIFTDCVNCLITFTKSRFNNDVCLNAIAFLRFCAVKLAEESFTCVQIIKDDGSSQMVLQDSMDSRPHAFFVSDSHASLWFPLLTGLSKLASDTRSSIRKSALEVLFNILKDHGHLFSQSFWNDVFVSVILPIYKCVHISGEATEQSDHDSPPTWDITTSSAAAECLVEVYVAFFNMLRPQLFMVVAVLTDFIKSSAHGVASAGMAALLHLSANLGGKLSELEWAEILFALKETAISIQLVFLRLLSTVDVEMPDDGLSGDSDSGSTETVDDDDDDGLQNVAYVVSRTKGHIAVQLLVVQLMVDLYKMHAQFLSASSTQTLLEIYSSIASHAHDLNCKRALLRKLHKACSVLELSDPPVLHFENESYQSYLNFIRTIFLDRLSLSAELNIEHKMVDVCAEILKIYLNCSGSFDGLHGRVHPWALSVGLLRKEQLAVRSSLAVTALRVLGGMGRLSFRKYLADLFPLLVGLVRAEHGSGEVQSALKNLFESCIGPIIMGL